MREVAELDGLGRRFQARSGKNIFRGDNTAIVDVRAGRELFGSAERLQTKFGALPLQPLPVGYPLTSRHGKAPFSLYTLQGYAQLTGAQAPEIMHLSVHF